MEQRDNQCDETPDPAHKEPETGALCDGERITSKRLDEIEALEGEGAK